MKDDPHAARFSLAGRRALVTGSTRGIGQAIARGLAEAGARVVLNARSADAVGVAVEAFNGDGFEASGRAFDVTDAQAVASAVDDIEAAEGPIDVLVNNAGIQRRAPVLDVDADTWQSVIDVNLTGVFRTAQAVARRMAPRRHGKIINIASLMSEVGRKTIAPYTAAKGGVKMLTRALCVELAEHGIQVNAIGPGYFATELNQALMQDPEFDGWLRRRTPAGRWGEVEELIGAAVFLASPASDFVNGQVLYVDGGLLAGI